jgi:UDP-N-acetylmuramoyl-tripeptide--D-alanyl-D-alanine ligase
MNFELFYETSGICTDSRNILKDSLFICLKGANFNGNEFAKQAIVMGAKYVICDEKKYANNINIFLVENSLHFLQKLANYHRKKFDIPVIGITGTNGKTTTKELIATVLETEKNVLYTKGNLNNHIGVPLTLLNLTKSHDIAVIEMGANKPGDINELVTIAEPTHGIITNMGKAHLEGFGSFEGVQTTKKELYDFIENSNGTLFYNEDDEILKKHIPSIVTHYSYSSIGGNSLVVGKLIRMSPFIEMQWKSNNYISPTLETSMIGTYNYYNFLAAVTIGIHFKISNENINKALTSYSPTNNRSQIQKTLTNTLILDAYNANPTSMKNAIESFSKMEGENKLLILGDMFELGETSNVEHTAIVDMVNTLNLNAFYVGEHFKQTNPNNTNFYTNKNELIEGLNNAPLKNKLILLKASRGIGLESIVHLL